MTTEVPIRWAADTWRSLTAMVDPRTALPADSVDAALTSGSRTGYTSPTNIAGYLWSVVAARELGLITRQDATRRCAETLATLSCLERHRPSGMFYNWYAVADGAVLASWGARGRRIDPFVSSVDNGWLATALLVVCASVPGCAERAHRLLSAMDFRSFYDTGARGFSGLLRGGFWPVPPRIRTVTASYLPGMPAVHYTRHHYDLLDSEPRIALYVGMARHQLPAAAYAALEAPVVRYRGQDLVVTYGGSMFEALAPALFVPEERWAPSTWGRNHAATVAAQREYGLDERGYGSWGFSPCACPGSGYREFGAPPIGYAGKGYRSEWRGEGVVTPHAAALALAVDEAAALDNLARLEREYPAYGPGGFVDSVGVRSGRTAGRYLALDQAMALGGFANALADGVLRRAFCTPQVTAAVRPVVAARAFPPLGGPVVSIDPRPHRSLPPVGSGAGADDEVEVADMGFDEVGGARSVGGA